MLSPTHCILGKWLRHRSLPLFQNDSGGPPHRGGKNGLHSFSSSASSGAPRPESSLPRIIPTKGVPIHLYANEIEPQALAQVRLLVESPLCYGMT